MPICRCIDYTSFCLLHLISPSLGHAFCPQITPVLSVRTCHSQQAPSTPQANQLCTSSAWHYQLAGCTKSRTSSRPLHIQLYFSLSERSGRRGPPAERSPSNTFVTKRVPQVRHSGRGISPAHSSQSRFMRAGQNATTQASRRQGCRVSTILRRRVANVRCVTKISRLIK